MGMGRTLGHVPVLTVLPSALTLSVYESDSPLNLRWAVWASSRISWVGAAKAPVRMPMARKACVDFMVLVLYVLNSLFKVCL